jgi:hypothetical protein
MYAPVHVLQAFVIVARLCLCLASAAMARSAAVAPVSRCGGPTLYVPTTESVRHPVWSALYSYGNQYYYVINYFY